MFVGKNYLVTCHQGDLPALARGRRAAGSARRPTCGLRSASCSTSLPTP